MARCPKCGRKLHVYNWRPDCPDCGVNMVYYKSNDRLLAETEAAEIAHAKSQPSIDRAKASFFGSAPAIVRIVLSLLPVAGLFLPLTVLSGAGGAKSINAIGVYNYISKADTGALFGNVLKGNLFSVSVVLLLLSAVMILVCLGCTVMSLGPHGKQRNLILNLITFTSALLSGILFTVNGAGISQINPEYSAVKPGAGWFVYLGLIAVLTVYNLILAKKGLKIKHTVCYIGGLPSEEYFKLVEDGVSELEIRKKMVVALTAMQDEVRRKAAEAEKKAEEERATHK